MEYPYGSPEHEADLIQFEREVGDGYPDRPSMEQLGGDLTPDPDPEAEAADAAWDAAEREAAKTGPANQPEDEQTIELDCAPGFPRPGDLIADVIDGTGLPKREARSKFFGCWTWDYRDIPREDWLLAQKITAPRVSKLYENGVIRYGSW